MESIKAFAIDIDGTLTENGGGIIHLPALASLRHIERLGYNVIYVTGRSSIEAFVLAVFGGTTKVAVGENGGAVTIGPQEHILLASRDNCMKGYEVLKKNMEGIKLKPAINRLTEVILLRTFNMVEAQKLLDENNLSLYLSDSKYAYHINERGIDKSTGLRKALEFLNVSASEVVAIGDSETDIPMFDTCGFSIALSHSDDNVKLHAKHVVSGKQGYGLVEAIDFITLNYLCWRQK